MTKGCSSSSGSPRTSFRLPEGAPRDLSRGGGVRVQLPRLGHQGRGTLLIAAGVPTDRAWLLQQATVANLARTGPTGALTGPAVRGDVGTIVRNLEALAETAPWAVDAYVEMARVALDLAVRSGRLGEPRRAEVEEALRPWI